MATSVSASVIELEYFYGDVDGFGFSPTAGLDNSLGGPADTDGDDLLEVGEFLPDLDGDGDVEIGSDPFDNRDAGDPLNTDVYFDPSPLVEISFIYSLPSGHSIASAELRIVLGDTAIQDASTHTIALYNMLTGEVVDSQDNVQSNGDIVETVVPLLSPALLSQLDDGAIFTIDYRAPDSDGIAIDYAVLHITLVDEPSLFVLVGFLLVTLVTIPAIRCRRCAPGPYKNL